MAYSLIFAEGSSDSALLTAALKRLGFSSCQKLSEVPESIAPHVPKKFPESGDRLNRVNSYPEILVRNGHHVAIINMGGFNNLSSSMRNAILIAKDLPQATIVFVDADNMSELDRFNDALQAFKDFVDVAESRLGIEGIVLPLVAASIMKGSVNTGIYVWPGAGSQGTLERVIIEGVEAEFPEVYSRTKGIAAQIKSDVEPTNEIYCVLDRGFNIDKATTLMMGAVICPTSSFNVYLSNSMHGKAAFFGVPALTRLVQFLEKFFD